MEFITMFTNRARSSELDASVNALTKGESYVLQRYGVNSRDELNEKNALWMQQSGAQVGRFQESSENAKLTFSLFVIAFLLANTLTISLGMRWAVANEREKAAEALAGGSAHE